jgi:two-component system, sensor histidine kinase
VAALLPDLIPSHSRILIIEDHADGRETLRRLLGLWGHEVEAAADGLRGVEKALAWRPDAAVVDIGLPLLDGYEVARRLRRELDDHIYLVALTGYGRPEDRARALEAGFDIHLVKPVDLEHLQVLLAHCAEVVLRAADAVQRSQALREESSALRQRLREERQGDGPAGPT